MERPLITVADMRKGLGEILNRAFYQNEVLEIAKHEKPVALVLSYNRKAQVDGIQRLAKTLDMDGDHLVERLEAIPEDKLREFLRDQINR